MKNIQECWHFSTIFGLHWKNDTDNSWTSWRLKLLEKVYLLKIVTGPKHRPKQWRRPSLNGKKWLMQPVQAQDLDMATGPWPSRTSWWSLGEATKELLTNYMFTTPVSFCWEVRNCDLNIYIFSIICNIYLIRHDFASIGSNFCLRHSNLFWGAFVFVFVCWKWRWPGRHLELEGGLLARAVLRHVTVSVVSNWLPNFALCIF